MSEQAILRLQGIEKFFGEEHVLKNISLDVEEGELITFIGPSGSGKTTLLRVIGGFHEQTEGAVILDGETIDQLPPEKRTTGMVFQNYALFPHMSVYDNVAYGLKLKKDVPAEERDSLIKDALKQVQLDGYEARKPSELSGGQQQRVAIARCLVLKPKVLLLDEPLSNLDANLRLIMRDEIRRLKEELNLTIVFVTHDQEEALSISDRVLVLKDGEVQQLDAPPAVYQHPENEFVAEFVGHANLIEGSFTGKEDGIVFQSDVSPELTFPLNIGGDWKGKKGTVLLRPEMITVDEDSPYQAEVKKAVYHGNSVRYHVDLFGEPLYIDALNPLSAKIHRRGDKVGLGFPDRVHIIPEDLPVKS
ncbi:ABC transporter ATP-binding protein [Salisediminibacterium halotolerans]|uniref:ABC transporter ATP-binding protein n=1 Tax=Salisediminibacterium halotolerans TaxID=517425 RepID=UPI000EB57FAE|nr:ABC transporter ATP-binding protein [Salisediminibacterium halotolerans]RLJ75625.1 iron(III) transport system ATP-binding protein/putative spermidine/putrescine transport system ATP-binding protein [Actinophytocola xinjiangensis]RPE89479.1 iron(III) transport system ATP-binding protein/putative spermidine/putrescine transport system ATP-binding protein/spermidine/putrescine transport system ATP-binding protein [Salisediminibacterium halotolerans]TWG36238.1 iron(III) transport system ATP-bindi